MVTSPDNSGTHAIEVSGNVPAFVDGALVVVGGRLRTENDAVPSVLGEREDRIGVGEVDDGERVRVRDSGTDRPLGDQYSRRESGDRCGAGS